MMSDSSNVDLSLTSTYPSSSSIQTEPSLQSVSRVDTPDAAPIVLSSTAGDDGINSTDFSTNTQSELPGYEDPLVGSAEPISMTSHTQSSQEGLHDSPELLPEVDNARPPSPLPNAQLPQDPDEDSSGSLVLSSQQVENTTLLSPTPHAQDAQGDSTDSLATSAEGKSTELPSLEPQAQDTENAPENPMEPSPEVERRNSASQLPHARDDSADTPVSSPSIADAQTLSVSRPPSFSLKDDDQRTLRSLLLADFEESPQSDFTDGPKTVIDVEVPLGQSITETPSVTQRIQNGETRQPGSAAPPQYVPATSDNILDRLGEELAPDSTVWQAYVTTAKAHDTEMVDDWNQSLDVLLIFASLFSAVVTAFVIESSKSLQPDYQQINALLTVHVLSALNGAGNASSLAGVPPLREILAFHKPHSLEAVNVLWYSALGFSFASVLIAMLSKQWLAAYISQQHDEPWRSSCERQRKFDALHRWSVPYILALLPALLHVSLFLFLVGLIIYLWQLDSMVSYVGCGIVGLLLPFYFASGTLAVFSSNCPYVTPLSQFISCRLPIKGKAPRPHGDFLVSRAVMWLATGKDQKTVATALQSLAGLRRGFVGYSEESAAYLARLALEHVQSCFVPEWRHGGSYSLLTDKQHEASRYARTLMHFVDDSRTKSSTVSAILDDPTLPIFLNLLACCSDHSIALLALCDNQRLLHRKELVRWYSVCDRDGCHDILTAAKYVRSRPAIANMERIVEKLDQYSKTVIFLHPFAIEAAVETIGYAPLPWVVTVSNESPLQAIMYPLLRLLHATRDGVVGVRHALSRTLSIMAQIHSADRLPEGSDLAMRFERALSVASTTETMDGSEDMSRTVLLMALSHFIATFAQEDIPVTDICEEFFYECDRRTGKEDPSFSDKAAVAALLPLLGVSQLADDRKAQALERLYNNAVSAAPGYLSYDPFLYHITPLDPFPSEAVPVLVQMLDMLKATTHSWIRNASILLYLITRSLTHRQHLLSNVELIISIIHSAVMEEVANHLFWMLTSFARDAALSSDSDTIQILVSAGILDMFISYRTKYGLTPADVHAWIDIIVVLLAESHDTTALRGLVEAFESQDDAHMQHLFTLREPILQFSCHPSTTYTPEAALGALRMLRNAFPSLCSSDSHPLMVEDDLETAAQPAS